MELCWELYQIIKIYLVFWKLRNIIHRKLMETELNKRTVTNLSGIGKVCHVTPCLPGRTVLRNRVLLVVS